MAGANCSRPEQRNPLGGSASILSTLTHTHSNSFALSSPGPNISPLGLRLLAALDLPPPSYPFTTFNLSPLCRHPQRYKYRCQSSIPTFYPLQPPHLLYTMPQGVLPPIRDILPGASLSRFFSLALSLLLSRHRSLTTHPLAVKKQVIFTMSVPHQNLHRARAMRHCRSRISRRPGQS